MKKRIPEMIFGCLLLLTLYACITFVVQGVSCRNTNIDKKKSCVVHLHNAGKSLSLSELQTELEASVKCLPSIKSTCKDKEFDNKLEVVKSLLTESQSISPSDKLQQEAMFQKVNRILFDGGTSCYKGHCQYGETVLICRQISNVCE